MPRRNRDYRAEYARRIELGRERGLSTKAARGHITVLDALANPERHQDWLRRHPDQVEALRDSDRAIELATRAVAEQEARGEIPLDPLSSPPPPGWHMSADRFDTLADARAVARRAVGYTYIRQLPGGSYAIVWRDPLISRTRRRRRAAA